MGTPAFLLTKRVFVVDDEANIADTLSLILRRVGFTVRTFYDGQAALEHAQRETPDIVLSDIVMPKMDGLELASKVREQFPHCRILLISGNACYSALLSKRENANGHELAILAKPVHPDIIIRKLTAMAVAADATDSRPSEMRCDKVNRDSPLKLPHAASRSTS
jgi:CheY-like chemotaxis protein